MGSHKKVHLRHKIVFTLLKPLFIICCYLIYGYKCKAYKLHKKQPYLILANHNSNMDPFFLSQSFDIPIYFVASDHIFRLGFISKVIKYLVAPIPIAKSQIDLHCIKYIKSVIKEGGSIGLFPSGNKSFNGGSPYISPSIAKLIKSLKVPVILYRIEGMYLSSPRWANKIRKGKSRGYVARELTIEEINSLSNEELMKIIENILEENSYSSQEINKVKYKGKNLAENLERVLYICPHCKSLNSLKSENNKLECSCGYSVIYNEYGLFEKHSDHNFIFENVYKWDLWQKEYLKELYNNNKLFKENEPVYIDANQLMYQCIKASENKLIDIGTLSIYEDRIELSNETITKIFYLKEIVRITCHGKQVIQFTLKNNEMYEIKSKAPRSATKYIHLYNLIKYGGDSNEFNGI